MYERMTQKRRAGLALEFIETDKRDAVRSYLLGGTSVNELFRTAADADRYGRLLLRRNTTS